MDKQRLIKRTITLSIPIISIEILIAIIFYSIAAYLFLVMGMFFILCITIYGIYKWNKLEIENSEK